MYAEIKDGAVVSTCSGMPRNTKHVSFGDFTTRGDLKKAGFLPLEEVRPPYDPAHQRLEGPTYEVLATKVKAVYTVVEQDLHGLIDAKIDAIRVEAGRRTSELHSLEDRLIDLEALHRIPGISQKRRASILNKQKMTALIWAAAFQAITEVETATSGVQAVGVMVKWPV